MTKNLIMFVFAFVIFAVSMKLSLQSESGREILSRDDPEANLSLLLMVLFCAVISVSAPALLFGIVGK